MPDHPPELQQIEALLERRMAIIADHAWRDSDPDAHLAALANNAAGISAWLDANHAAIDPQLRHFLTRSSLTKALDWLQANPQTPPRQAR